MNRTTNPATGTDPYALPGPADTHCYVDEMPRPLDEHDAADEQVIGEYLDSAPEWLAPAVTAVAAAAADVDPDQWVEQYLAELQVCGALTFREMVTALKRWHERRGIERIGDAVANAATLVIEFLDGPFAYTAVSGLDLVVAERGGDAGVEPVSVDALYDAAVLLAEGARADLVGAVRWNGVPYSSDLRHLASVSDLVYDVATRYQRAAAVAGQRLRVVGL